MASTEFFCEIEHKHGQSVTYSTRQLTGNLKTNCTLHVTTCINLKHTNFCL